MKFRCKSCGSEWSTGSSTQSSHNRCPFCGKTILQDELSKDNLTLSLVLKQIIDNFGLNILLNRQKCIGIFKDLAPSLKEEEKILDVALKLDVGTYFFDVHEDEREAAIKKAIYAMDGILAEEAIESVLSAFVNALNWEESLLSDSLNRKEHWNANILRNNVYVEEKFTERTPKENISGDKKLREQKIKAVTESTLQKADDLREKAYIAAGVAANIASAVLRKASGNNTETTERSIQTVSGMTEAMQIDENETVTQQTPLSNPEGFFYNETFLESGDGIESLAEGSVQRTTSPALGQCFNNSSSNSATALQNIPVTPTSTNSATSHSSSGNLVSNYHQQQNNSAKMKKSLIVAVVLAFCGFVFFSLVNDKQNITSPSKPNTAYTGQQKQTVVQQPIIKQSVTTQKSNLDLTKEFLSGLGYHREAPYIKATTYGNSTDGFLFYEFGLIWIFDSKRNRMAGLLNTSDVMGKYKLYRKNNTNNPLILKLGIGKDTEDKDANNGLWDKEKNNFHLIPVYVLYDFNSDGTMVDKGLYSGKGENPSHFHNYLYEQKNVDMVNIFLKQLPYFDQSVFNDFPMAEESSINKPTTPLPIKSTNNSVEARNTFIRFHQAITDKRLGDAYFILSPNYRKIMKSYDNFARGYITTLRSDIVELNTLHEDSSSASYSYKLKAVDREGSGTKTQFFSGKVNLIKINGNWLIDSTEAKRL